MKAVLLLAGFLVGILAHTGCQTRPADGTPLRAEITNTRGFAQSRTDSSSGWMSAHTGQQLASGGALETGPGAAVTLRVRPGGPIVTVQPDSRVEFVALSASPINGATSTILKVSKGEVVVDDNPSLVGSTAEIRSLRGTARIPPKKR